VGGICKRWSSDKPDGAQVSSKRVVPQEIQEVLLLLSLKKPIVGLLIVYRYLLYQKIYLEVQQLYSKARDKRHFS